MNKILMLFGRDVKGALEGACGEAKQDPLLLGIPAVLGFMVASLIGLGLTLGLGDRYALEYGLRAGLLNTVLWGILGIGIRVKNYYDNLKARSEA